MGSSKTKLLYIQLFSLLFFLTFYAHSQFYHGLDVGINMNNADFRFNESSQPSKAFGFHLGYLAERDLNDNLYIRLGLTFQRREFKAIANRGINTTAETWGLDALELPINFGYYVNWNNRNLQFFVDAGINIGYNKRAFVKNDTETIRLDIGAEADIKRIGMGANLGLGLLIKKRLKLRVNYYNGLSNIMNDEENSWKNKTVALSLNYFLREKQVY